MVSELLATVGAEPLDASAIAIRVHDTGIGIPRLRLQAIFDPFVQVDTSRTRTGDGAGLGLAISRDLARGMGAKLTVVSTLREGSVSRLTLPRGRESEEGVDEKR